MATSTKKSAYAHTGATLRIFWQHAMRYPWRVAAVMFGVLFYTAVQTSLPLFYRNLVDTLTRIGGGGDIRPAIRIIFFVFVLSLVRATIWRVANFANNFFQSRVMSDLLATCYRYLGGHSYSFFNSRFVGSLVTKVRRYERSFETMADQVVFNLGRTLLDTGMIVAILLWQYRPFGYGMLGWIAVFLAFSYWFSLFKLPYDLRRASADTQTTAQLADSITNNVNVKLFSNRAMEERRFGAVLEEQFLARKKSWDLGTWGDAVQAFSMITLEFVMMYFALRSWGNGSLSIGDIVLLQAYLARIFDKLWDTGKNIRNIYEAIADANEMTEMLIEPHAIQDAPDATALKPQGGEVEFKRVNFNYYENVPVLKHFDLTVAPGERVALIGPSGGGKSTILRLMLRLHDVKGGEILIDGQNIATVTQDSLRQAIAFVPQEPILFHRSLMENIRYAKPKASEKEVFRAAKLAHAHEFITSFPQKYETLVGERGVKLSGGERQRVAIARAILKDAPILMLDEATSSLDSESERYIQEALTSLMQGRTTIVVAHRLSTIMQMDRIIVVDHGKIIEEGKHKELLKVQQGLYQKLWGIQAGGFAA